MPDLDALKSRVERAERHMEAAQAARESQNAALVEMWRQIRARFAAQEREIAEYRAKLAALEDEHETLLAQVESLLAVVDRSVGRASDETVPKIAGMAQSLLDGEEVPDVATPERTEIEIVTEPDDEADDRPDDPADDVPALALPPVPADADAGAPDEAEGAARTRARREVRDIVGRIQGANLAPAAAPDPNADPRQRERDDIEDLRAELAELGVRLGVRRS